MAVTSSRSSDEGNAFFEALFSAFLGFQPKVFAETFVETRPQRPVYRLLHPLFVLPASSSFWICS